MTRLAALALMLAVQPAGAQDVSRALARAEGAYRQTTALQAEFTQEITNPMLGGPERARGVLYLAPPTRFAMRFTEPAGDRIVADGTWLWLYTPSTVPGQVIRQPVPKTGANTPNLFAQFVDRPTERYDATYAGTDSVAGAEVDLVRLIPKAADPPFREATIAVARTDGLLRRIALIEAGGQRRTLVFVKIGVVAAIPPQEVTFRVPRGVKVVTP